jgi:hypothetical protein
MTGKKKRSAGRPTLPPGQRRVAISITLAQAQLAWLDGKGDPRSAVIRRLIADEIRREGGDGADDQGPT